MPVYPLASNNKTPTMRFYLTLQLIGLLFCLNAQDSAPATWEKVVPPNQEISIYNEVTVNSTAFDFSPSFFGDTLVFCSSRHAGPKDPKTGQSFFDFYYSPIGPNGALRSPKPFSINLNSPAHEGQASFDLKLDKIYFTRNNLLNGVDPSAEGGVVRMKIYEATLGLLDWERIEPLSFNSESFNTMHPALSEDGNFMIFASDRPGGKGGFDLYVSRKLNGRWSPPMNLGGRINTPGNEFFPFFHQSGTLFFSSDGYKKGYGNYDLYMVKGNGDGSWAEVVNLGPPFNTEADDFGLILDPEGNRGYFSSNREGGVGADDIYSFYAPDGIQGVVFPDFQTTTIEVFSEERNTPISGAGIKIYERVIDKVSGKIDYVRLPRSNINMGTDGKAEILEISDDLEEPDEKSNKEGKAYIMLDLSKEYKIKVEKRGFFEGEKFYMPSENNFNRPVEIALRRDDCITLEGVVTNSETGAVVPNVTIHVFNQEKERRQTTSTNESGLFKHCLLRGYRFTIEARCVGYEPAKTQVQTIGLRGNRSLGVAVQMKPLHTTPRSGGNDRAGYLDPVNKINQPPSLGNRRLVEAGGRFVLDNLQFEFASSRILSEAAVDLEHLAGLMMDNMAMRVELRAFTDCRGEEAYNRNLSLRRAEAARKFLTDRGISKDRILAFGYGESNPLVNCDCDGGGIPCTDADHAMNRRTEVSIIQK